MFFKKVKKQSKRMREGCVEGEERKEGLSLKAEREMRKVKFWVGGKWDEWDF